jgi:DNA-binding transcriptional LysR family regulator
MRAFARRWPDVRLRPTEAPADLALYEAVERGEVDLSFVELPAPEGPFETTELMADPYLLVVSASSPLAKRPITVADLREVPLVGHTECRGLARVEAQLRSRGIEPEFAFRSDVNATIQALVGAGVGAAVLPALAVDPDDALTVARELPGIPPRVLAVARHRDRYHSEAAQAFVEDARTVCAALSRGRRLAVVGE